MPEASKASCSALSMYSDSERKGACPLPACVSFGVVSVSVSEGATFSPDSLVIGVFSLPLLSESSDELIPSGAVLLSAWVAVHESSRETDFPFCA